MKSKQRNRGDETRITGAPGQNKENGRKTVLPRGDKAETDGCYRIFTCLSNSSFARTGLTQRCAHALRTFAEALEVRGTAAACPGSRCSAHNECACLRIFLARTRRGKRELFRGPVAKAPKTMRCRTPSLPRRLQTRAPGRQSQSSEMLPMVFQRSSLSALRSKSETVTSIAPLCMQKNARHQHRRERNENSPKHHPRRWRSACLAHFTKRMAERKTRKRDTSIFWFASVTRLLRQKKSRGIERRFACRFRKTCQRQPRCKRCKVMMGL